MILVPEQNKITQKSLNLHKNGWEIFFKCTSSSKDDKYVKHVYFTKLFTYCIAWLADYYCFSGFNQSGTYGNGLFCHLFFFEFLGGMV